MNPEHIGRVVPRVIAKLAPRDLFHGMNKWEAEHAQLLEAQKRRGEIREWWYERWTWKLADDTRFTPDFVVEELSGELRVDEVKGHFRDDAKVKLKVFAALYPIRVRLCQKQQGQWKVTDVSQGMAA